MNPSLENFTRLLSQDTEKDEETEDFDLIYRGSSEIDRHYTKPMLPWIISEIKNQHKTIQVCVSVKNGFFEVRNKENKEILVSHRVKQIHKCVMEQADHRCFLYTLRPSEKDSQVNQTPVSLQPANISHNQNYHCHLYQALTEQEVRNFFSCLRQQPKETKIPDSDSLNSLPELSVHTESLFFEVMFVGRVKVSHCKVPVTFIDEALAAFKQKEKRRQRNASGEARNPSSPNRLMSFKHEGSGYSVPNIVIRNLATDPSMTKYSKIEPPVNQELGTQTKSAREGGPLSIGSSSTQGFVIEPFPSTDRSSITAENDTTKSISSSRPGEPQVRGRSGSTGNVWPQNKFTRPSDSDLKALGYDFNRTMLFHIGHREIQLVNPELKNVQLHKSFKDIAMCLQGVQATDHFGFVCKELSSEAMVFVGYVFRCDNESVSEEIIQVLNRSFSAMHEEHERDRKEHLMCDFCPLKWFSGLCAEVEGLPAQKAHYIIMKRIIHLPEEERETIIAKYEGAETSEVAQKNNVLMMLLRTHFEYKQMNHTHPSDTSHKSEFLLGPNIESSFKKAKQTLTTSFSQLLKKKDDSSSDKENQKPVEVPTVKGPSASAAVVESAPPPKETKARLARSGSISYVLEGVSDSPLKPVRQRASTVSGTGLESVKKDLIAAKKEPKTLTAPLSGDKESDSSDASESTSGAKTNMFLKINAPIPYSPCEDEAKYEREDELKPIKSFRQSILKTVASPAKGVAGVPEQRTRKISTGYLGKKDGSAKVRFNPLRTPGELKIIWKKAVFQQIILLRIERENQRMRALQKEAALQKVRLNYEEEELPPDSQQVWEMLLSRPQARIDNSILIAGIKQGIPKMIRGDVWNLLMIQNQIYGQNPRQKRTDPQYNTPYEVLIKELASNQHSILIDLGRTFPTHPYFTQTLGPGQLALFNILKAYSILDPEVGYCQGLSFVVGVLLMHLEEELAYHVFKHLMFDRGCRKQFRNELEGLQVRMYQLSRLVHDKLHELYEHLEEHEVTPQLYAAPWFLTLFASQFPLNFVVRVFDLLFLRGIEAVFCVALTLLKYHEQQLLRLSNFELVMEFFKSNVPCISTNQLASFFDQACEYEFADELSAYEVEYNVLKEELFFSPQHDANLAKQKEMNSNLKRQNLDLLDQLHSAKLLQQSLESSNQSLLQSQHHLEVRVRWLEMERNNMRLLIQTLHRNATPNALREVPASLQRYLPNRASSPSPLRAASQRSDDSMRSLSTILSGGTSFQSDRSSDDDVSSISIPVPSQVSWTPASEKTKSNLLVAEHPAQTRSATLDPKDMREYLRQMVNHE